MTTRLLALGLRLGLLLTIPAWEVGAQAAQGEAASSSPREQAKVHYQRGAAAYKAARYKEAHDEFLQSFQQSGLQDLLYNLSVAAEHMGRPDMAADYLEQYLRNNPPDRATVESEVLRLRRAQRAQQIEKEATSGVPETPQQESPAPPQPAAVQHQQQAVPAPDLTVHGTPEPGVHPRRWPPAGALVLLGGGAGLLAIGLGLGGGAMADANQLSALPAGMPYNKSLERQGQALNAAGIALDVLGAAALCAGGVWTGVWVYRSKHPTGATAALVPAGLGLGLAGGF